MTPNRILTIRISTNQKTVVHRCSVKFTEKLLCWSLFFDKTDSNTGFPVSFGIFLRTSFFTEHFWWLFINTTYCQKSQKLATSIPVHLFALRGMRNFFWVTRLRNWFYLINNDCLICRMTDSGTA